MRITNTKKRIFFGVILFAVVLVLLFVFYPSNKNELSYRTDIEPVSSRFPKLKGIQKVYWSTKVINDDFGPTSYLMRGYVILEHSAVSYLTTAYTWESVDVEPKLKYAQHGLAQILRYSEEFNSFIKPSNYVGEFYLDDNSDSLYFEIEQ